MSFSIYVKICFIVCFNCLVLTFVTADINYDIQNRGSSKLPVAQAIHSLPPLLPYAMGVSFEHASMYTNSVDSVPKHGSVDGSNSIPVSKRRLPTTVCITTDGSEANSVDCTSGTSECTAATGRKCEGTPRHELQTAPETPRAIVPDDILKTSNLKLTSGKGRCQNKNEGKNSTSETTLPFFSSFSIFNRY